LPVDCRLFFLILCTSYVASGLSFVFLHLVYPLCCLWIVVLFFFILCTPYVASGLPFVFLHLVYPLCCLLFFVLFFFILCNIGGTQDEEKQNDSPEKLAT
jgi:hypothetical protein